MLFHKQFTEVTEREGLAEKREERGEEISERDIEENEET